MAKELTTQSYIEHHLTKTPITSIVRWQTCCIIVTTTQSFHQLRHRTSLKPPTTRPLRVDKTKNAAAPFPPRDGVQEKSSVSIRAVARRMRHGPVSHFDVVLISYYHLKCYQRQPRLSFLALASALGKRVSIKRPTAPIATLRRKSTACSCEWRLFPLPRARGVA